MSRTCSVHKLFFVFTFRTIYLHNIFLTCSELGIFTYWTRNSMKHLSSYCGLVDVKIWASDKDLPVTTAPKIAASISNFFFFLYIIPCKLFKYLANHIQKVSLLICFFRFNLEFLKIFCKEIHQCKQKRLRESLLQSSARIVDFW